MCHQRFSLAYGFYTKLYTKLAVSESSTLFNRAREIEFNFFTAWTFFMKPGTLVHHVHCCKKVAADILIFAWGLSYGLSKSKKRAKFITYRRFTRRADRRLPPGCYGNLIVNVKRGQSRPKRACGVDPDRHDCATFTFTVIAEVRSCCTEMTKES